MNFLDILLIAITTTICVTATITAIYYLMYVKYKKEIENEEKELTDSLKELFKSLEEDTEYFHTNDIKSNKTKH